MVEVVQHVASHTELPAWQMLVSGETSWWWMPVRAVEFAFEYAHHLVGMPWWTVFVAAPFVLRIILAPVYISQLKNSAKLQELSPQVREYSMRAQMARTQGKTDMGAYFAGLNDLYKKNGVSMFAGFRAAFIQMPFFVTLFLAIREMSTTEIWHAALAQGGAAWFRDLTIADPYYLLPVAAGLTTWAMMVRRSLPYFLILS